MQVYCRLCGKPLRDPISIARGLGPKCAGISMTRKRYRAPAKVPGERRDLCLRTGSDATDLFSYLGERQPRWPETLRCFPSDLVDLVLSAPAAGSIGTRIKHYSRRTHTNPVHPAKMLKQIRRICIEFRLLFWPGLFKELAAIPCIPYGETDWRIGENGKVCSKDELVSYLSRYGMISSQDSE